MSPKMPTVTPKIMTSFLEYLGFKEVRQRGSHHFFRHMDGRTATVPEHGNEDLGRGITSKILRDVEADRDDFIEWYKRNH